jgi:pilus assembly protein Flp/PilA
MLNAVKRFLREEEGLEMLEWAIVALLFAVAGAATWGLLGGTISTSLGGINTSLSGKSTTF